MARTYTVKASDDGGDREYSVDAGTNPKAALGFLKDWITSIIQIESAGIAAIGAFIGIKGPDYITWPEAILIAISVILLALSIDSGVYLLHALPGAVQRTAVNDAAKNKDLYFLANEGDQRTILEQSVRFRHLFRGAVIAIATLILAHLLIHNSVIKLPYV